MADLPTHPDNHDHISTGPDRGPAAGAFRWKSALGIAIVVALVLLFVVLHLTGVLGPESHD
jgi:hypothetical protein